MRQANRHHQERRLTRSVLHRHRHNVRDVYSVYHWDQASLASADAVCPESEFGVRQRLGNTALHFVGRFPEMIVRPFLITPTIASRLCLHPHPMSVAFRTKEIWADCCTLAANYPRPSLSGAPTGISATHRPAINPGDPTGAGNSYSRILQDGHSRTQIETAVNLRFQCQVSCQPKCAQLSYGLETNPSADFIEHFRTPRSLIQDIACEGPRAVPAQTRRRIDPPPPGVGGPGRGRGGPGGPGAAAGRAGPGGRRGPGPGRLTSACPVTPGRAIGWQAPGGWAGRRGMGAGKARGWGLCSILKTDCRAGGGQAGAGAAGRGPDRRGAGARGGPGGWACPQGPGRGPGKGQAGPGSGGGPERGGGGRGLAGPGPGWGRQGRAGPGPGPQGAGRAGGPGCLPCCNAIKLQFRQKQRELVWLQK